MDAKAWKELIEFACMDWSILSQVFSAGATVALAIIAGKGLSAWKRQTKTQMKIKFIDELINAVSDYVIAMEKPIQKVLSVEIGIKSYSSVSSPPGDIQDGFVRFIQACGEKWGGQLFDSFEAIRPIKAEVQTLMAKGQALGFDEYNSAFNACQNLIWTHGYVGGLAGLISNPNFNWSNQMVKDTLDKYRNVSSSELQEKHNQNYVEILKFAKNNYEKLLG